MDKQLSDQARTRYGCSAFLVPFALLGLLSEFTWNVTNIWGQAGLFFILLVLSMVTAANAIPLLAGGALKKINPISLIGAFFLSFAWVTFLLELKSSSVYYSIMSIMWEPILTSASRISLLAGIGMLVIGVKAMKARPSFFI